MNDKISPLLESISVQPKASSAKTTPIQQDNGFSDSLKEAQQELKDAMQSKTKKVESGEEVKKAPPKVEAQRPDNSQSASLEVADKAGPTMEQVKQQPPSIDNVVAEADQLLETGELLLTELPIEGITEAVANLAQLTEPTNINILSLDIAATATLDDINAWLQQHIANENGLKETLAAILGPEQASSLIETWVANGQQLPAQPELVPALEAIKQAIAVQQAAISLQDPKANNMALVPPLAGSTSTLSNGGSGNIAGMTLVADAASTAPSAQEATATIELDLANMGSSKLLTPKTDVAASSLMGQWMDQDSVEQLRAVFEETAPVSATQASLDTNLPPASMQAAIGKAQLSVVIPFQQAQWGQAVAERVMWMSSKGIQEAEIHLDPPELGPLQVKVSMANEQAHVSFVVQHSSVREALDQNAMRLREMFDAEGIDLVDVDVSDQSEQNADRSDDDAQESNHFFSHGEADVVSGETSINSSINGYSLINTYV